MKATKKHKGEASKERRSEKSNRALEYLEWATSLKMIFIPFGLNEALQTIRRLHLKGFDMTNIMKDYKNLWDEYKEKDVWRLIEPKTMDMYVSAHNLILKDIEEPLPKRASVQLSEGEQDALKALEDAQKANDPFEFTKAAITAIFDGTGVRSRIQDKIVEGAKALALRDHHKALIFEVVARAGLRPLLRRLYRQGTFAIVKNVEDIGAMINYEDLPYLTDEEFLKAANQHQGKHERSRDLIALLKPVEEKSAFEFAKVAVKIIHEGDIFLQDFVVDGATRFGQFEIGKQLKPYHKYLILLIAIGKRNVDLIQRLCLSGPLFPLTYKFNAIAHESDYAIEDVISATSDDELLKIAVWADEQGTMAALILGVLQEGELRENMIKKLGEELGGLLSLDYAYQLSRYVIEGLSANVIERVQRLDTEDVLLELMSSFIMEGNVLEFVKTSVAAILIMGKRS